MGKLTLQPITARASGTEDKTCGTPVQGIGAEGTTSRSRRIGNTGLLADGRARRRAGRHSPLSLTC